MIRSRSIKVNALTALTCHSYSRLLKLNFHGKKLNSGFFNAKLNRSIHNSIKHKNGFFGSFLAMTTFTASIVGLGFGYLYFRDVRSGIHRWLLVPLMHTLDAETAHKLAIKFLDLGISPIDSEPDDPSLETFFLGKKLSNPLCLAAGFDKNGEAIDGLFNLGFSYVEIGTITPKPQLGNPKPRVFRLREDKAIINRYGFNSKGIDFVLQRLLKRIVRNVNSNNKSLIPNKVLAINVGKNRNSKDAEKDFVEGIRQLGNFADFLVVNVSSPNTPGLRDLQQEHPLLNLLKSVVQARDDLKESRPPILVKISPDINESDIDGIANAIKTSQVDGVIVGGLSGKPLKNKSIEMVKKLRYRLPSCIEIVACGGIFSGKDAIDYAKAGASLIQIYSSFAYEGVSFPNKLKNDILKELNGKTWMQIVEETKSNMAQSII